MQDSFYCRIATEASQQSATCCQRTLERSAWDGVACSTALWRTSEPGTPWLSGQGSVTKSINILCYVSLFSFTFTVWTNYKMNQQLRMSAGCSSLALCESHSLFFTGRWTTCESSIFYVPESTANRRSRARKVAGAGQRPLRIRLIFGEEEELPCKLLICIAKVFWFVVSSRSVSFPRSQVRFSVQRSQLLA